MCQIFKQALKLPSPHDLAAIRIQYPFFILFLITLFSPETLFAQFTIDAQYRNRFEFRSGYKKLAAEGSTPAAFISQRSRLSAGFENERVKLKFTPQDVRVWGDEQMSSSTAVYGDYASLDLLEAWVQLKTGGRSWLSIGRQFLVYDNQRILAARNWNQNSIAYDAVVFKWDSGSRKIHLGSCWNSTGENLSDNFYYQKRVKSLSFLWAQQSISENCDISVSHIASGVAKTDSTNKLYFRQTTGLYTTCTQGGFIFSGNIYYQFGKNNSGEKVSAWLADLETAFITGKLTSGVGLSYLSGNKTTGSQRKTDHLFDVLYGARHRFFGAMDYFSNFGSHTQQGGLADLRFCLGLKLSGKTKLSNTGHYFRLAKTNENTPGNKNLGYENDLILKHKFSGWGDFECGYLFFLPTASLETIQGREGSKYSHFFYLQLTITPVLFKTTKFKNN